ncbi:MAG: hypothetical protein AAGD96_18615 [Chloroflexota bacterium]
MPATVNFKSVFSFLAFVLPFFIAGCVLGEPIEPTAVPSVTPPGDMLSLTTANYTYTLVENQQIPGTKITYRSRDGDNIFIDIDQQAAVRRIGDTLTGTQLMVPGAHVHYNLRLISAAFSNPYVFGPVTITIFNPQPLELTNLTEPPPATIVYEGIGIDFRVPPGRMLPGSSVTFLGVDDLGARLGGTAQYPSLPEQNSFVWTGRLSNHAIIRYDLTAVSVLPDELQMRGEAKLYLYKNPLN